MELWLRSQDKKHLLKCEALLIEGVGNNRFGIGAFTKNYDFDIANFETKERALEVLDEIHQLLIDLQTLEITKGDFRFAGKRNLNCVYEMPRE